MEITPEIEQFWQAYLSSLPAGVERPQLYTAWYFDNNPAGALELAELVLAGVKTATASLLWSFEAENEAVPQPGDYSVITDFSGHPLGIIESTQITLMPYREVDAEQAYLEGEGDRSLAFWREAHWRFFSQECATLGREPFEEMPVVCERFRLVYPL